MNSLVLTQLVNEQVRTPDLDWTLDANGDPVPHYSVPLTAAERATLDDVYRYVRAGIAGTVTFAEFLALKPALADARSQRQRTDAQWSALTAAQRDTQLIAWCRDITDLLRAMLRDG